MNATTDVCVIGGGLAGIAAAADLAERGAAVTLLEARPELGGAVRSLHRGDLITDNGQHVFLRCYDQYRALLDRMGAGPQTRLQDRFSVTVVAPGHPPQTLSRSRLPAPFHLLAAVGRYRLLTTRERTAALRAALALRAVDPDDPDNDRSSFGRWLAEHGQSDRAIRRLWDVIAVAALNIDSMHASLALAARVFRTGLLDRADSSDIGQFTAPLSRVHDEAARLMLDRLGVTVITRTRARSVHSLERGFIVETSGRPVVCESVVVAVPHRLAGALLPRQAQAGWERWRELSHCPIVNVHMRFDKVVMNVPFAAAVESPAQWIFDRTELSGQALRSGGQYLVVSLSAADRHLHRTAAQLISEQAAALAELFPQGRRSRMLDAFVTREPFATFRASPLTRALRPGPKTALPGLTLAGAWTDTGWPDTMEGAVRSGMRAAAVTMSHLSAGHDIREIVA
jgi:squalene-associated FAD-dependent desaturase